jgi:hypothetical protein
MYLPIGVRAIVSRLAGKQSKPLGSILLMASIAVAKM